jgi:hypothetical protein
MPIFAIHGKQKEDKFRSYRVFLSANTPSHAHVHTQRQEPFGVGSLAWIPFTGRMGIAHDGILSCI